jgi:hypothetical protein
MEWVIAEWDEEGEGRLRAPSYRAATGVWYRASSDRQGPVILRMDGEPLSLTHIQGSSPQRTRDAANIDAALARQEVRIAAMSDRLSRLDDFASHALNRIERDLARLGGRGFADNPWQSIPPSLLSPVAPPGPQKTVAPGHTHSCGGGNYGFDGAVTSTSDAVRKFKG